MFTYHSPTPNFIQYPDVVPLFQRADMALQANKLRKTISIAVQYLDNMDELLPVLANLGKRHALEWEVKQHHYDAVGECLLWTLQTGLEDAWTDDVGKPFLLLLGYF